MVRRGVTQPAELAKLSCCLSSHFAFSARARTPTPFVSYGCTLVALGQQSNRAKITLDSKNKITKLRNKGISQLHCKVEVRTPISLNINTRCIGE